MASTAAGKEARKENLLEVQRIQTVFERCSAYTSEAYEMIKITKEEMGKPNLAKQKAIIGKTMNPSLNQEVEDLALRVFSSFKVDWMTAFCKPNSTCAMAFIQQYQKKITTAHGPF